MMRPRAEALLAIRLSLVDKTKRERKKITLEEKLA